MKSPSSYPNPRRGFKPLAAFLTALALTAALKVQAASGTWTNTPASGAWTNVLNWNGGVVPGTINNTANNGVDGTSIANFTNAISTYGGSANSVVPDDGTIPGAKARMLSQLNFDGANCGAYVFSSPSAYQVQVGTTYTTNSGIITTNLGVPETGVLSLCIATTAANNNGSYIGAAVAKPQNFLLPVQIRLPSSTTGVYGFTNNATSPLGTYYFNNLFLYPGASGRALTYVFAGSNTGTNTVAALAQSVNTTAACTVLKQGTGRWIFSGANTFKSGSPMNILGGTLEVQNASAFGLSSSVLVSNATLQIDGVTLASTSITLKSGGSLQMNGSGTLNGVVLGTDLASSMTLATTSASDVSTVSAISGGALDGVVHIAGPGTVAFSSDNLAVTNSTWSFDGGTNQLATPNSLGATPKNLVFGSGSTGVLALNGQSIVAQSLNSTAGTPSVQNVNGTAATLTVSNSTANNFTGSLADGAGGGALALTKLAAGTLNLSGASAYTGNTTISAGILNLTGSLGSTAVTVASGATLTGAASIAGSVTVQSGGILDPGNAGTAGKLTTGSLTLNSGSVNAFEFDTAPTNDQVIVTGSGGLTLNGGAIYLYQTNGNSFAAAGTYNLIQYSGAIGGTGVSSLSIGNPSAGYAYAFGASGGYVTVTITTSGVNATWNNDANGNWSPGTWSGGTAPHARGDSATLGVGSALRTVTLNVAETVGGLTFTNSNSFVVNGGSTLTLDNKGVGAPIGVTAGTANVIQTAVSMNDNVTATVSSGKSLTVSGVVSSTSAQTLTVNGAGTVALAGSNSYGPAAGSVGTILSGGGTLNVANNNALSAGDVDITGSSKLQAGSAGLSLANNVIIESSVNATVDNNGNNVSLGGIISGNGNLVKNGSGTLALGGANTYNGTTTVNAGVLSITLDGSLGTAPGAETASSVVLNGGTLLGTGSVSLSSARDIGIGLGAGSVGTNAQIDAASGGTFYIGGVIASSGNTGVNGLTVNSGPSATGTVVLSGANTFNGPTYIAQGSLQLANTLALQNSVLDYTNGTLLFDGGTTAATIAEIIGTQGLALTNLNGNGVTLTLGGDNGSVTYQGNFTDTGAASGGALSKAGTGTLTLAGTNSLTGNLGVGNGFVQIASNGVTVVGTVGVTGSSAPELIVSGGFLAATNITIAASGSAGPGNMLISSGTASFSGTVAVDAASSQNSVNCGLTVNTNGSLYASYLNLGRGSLSATAQPAAGTTGQGLNVTGGTVIITNNISMGTMVGANSGTSLIVSGGSLTVGGTFIFGCDNGGRWSVVDVSGGSLTVTDIVTGIDIGGPYAGAGQVLLVRGGTVAAGIINLGNGTNSGTSAIDLTSGSLYLGAGGIVQVSSNAASSITLNGGVLGATADWTATNPMTLGGAVIQAADAGGTAHSILLGGPIGGTVLTKTGGGTLTLTNGNYFTGGASLNAGTLNINGSWALGGAVYGGMTFNGGKLQFAPAFAGNGPGDFSENTAATPVAQPVTFASNATVDVNGNTVTCAYGIGNGGNGSLTVQSGLPGGVLNLQGTNNYNGNTTVTSGSTLELGLPTLHSNTTVTVNTGGVLQLDFTGQNLVNTVVLGGITYTTPGVYNNANHAPFITGVGSLVIPSSIASYSTNIIATVTGNLLTVSWPATHLGWELMSQTNSLSTGLGNNWVTNYGTAGVLSTNFTINPANGSVFYRLVHP